MANARVSNVCGNYADTIDEQYSTKAQEELASQSVVPCGGCMGVVTPCKKTRCPAVTNAQHYMDCWQAKKKTVSYRKTLGWTKLVCRGNCGLLAYTNDTEFVLSGKFGGKHGPGCDHNVGEYEMRTLDEKRTKKGEKRKREKTEEDSGEKKFKKTKKNEKKTTVHSSSDVSDIDMDKILDEEEQSKKKERRNSSTPSIVEKKIFPQIIFKDGNNNNKDVEKIEVENTGWPSYWNYLKLNHPSEFEDQTSPNGVAHTIMFKPCLACTGVCLYRNGKVLMCKSTQDCPIIHYKENAPRMTFRKSDWKKLLDGTKHSFTVQCGYQKRGKGSCGVTYCFSKKEETVDGGAITVVSPLLVCTKISKHKSELHEVMYPKDEFNLRTPQWDALTEEEIQRIFQFAPNAKIQMYKQDVQEKIKEYSEQLEFFQEALKSLNHVNQYISQIEKNPQLSFSGIATLLNSQGNGIQGGEQENDTDKE